VTYPLIAHPYSPELMSKAAIVRFATRAEELGYAGIGFTDHPAPSHRWLTHGGHDAIDPFVGMGLVAAVTEWLRLIPNILVLPYRNPFVVAKAAATLDMVSDGRFVLAVATGYQRGEYRALGVDFDERNQLFDEALAVIKGIWSTDDFAYEGLHFTAKGQTANPKPTDIPIWIGGNSALSRRRVATSADCWAPFAASAMLAQTAKTPVLESVDDLVPMLDHLWRCVDEAGRDRKEVEVSMQALG
jgi:probable F420-dependent oxidoreductase